MARIPESFLQALRERTDIVPLIQERVSLRKTGTNYSACCPFHEEKTPSFTVSPSKQFFHCFGCGEHGDAIAFISRSAGLSFSEAVEKLAQRAGLSMPAVSQEDPAFLQEQKQLMEACTAATHYFQQQLQASTPAGQRALAYLHRRGLSRATIEKFQIGYAPESWQALYPALRAEGISEWALLATGLVIQKEGASGRIYDRFRGRVMFPIQDARGRCIGFGGRTLDPKAVTAKYLNSPETAIFHKGHSLYGLAQALRSPSIPYWIIVEGYMDVITLHQAGISGVVATMGTAMGAWHLKRLRQSGAPIIFCFDGDPAGQRAAWRALEVCLPLLEAGCDIRFIRVPEGDDPDSWVQRIGKAGFEQQVGQALPLSEFLATSLERQVSLDTVEGRAKLVSLAKPLLMQIPPGTYRTMMEDMIQKRVGLLNVARESRGERRFSRRPLAGPPTTLSQKMTWLLGCYPHWWEQLSLAEQELLRSAGVLKPQEAIQWIDTPQAQAWLLFFPTEGQAQAEWQAMLAKLRQGAVSEQVAQLLVKARQQGLSSAEKQQLKDLLER